MELQSYEDEANNINLNIFILKHGIFRIILDTKLNNGTRFRVIFIIMILIKQLGANDDVINSNTLAKEKNFNLVRNSTHLHISYKDKLLKHPYYIEMDEKESNYFELIVTFEPFLIAYYLNQREIVIINERNLLNIEIPHEPKTENDAGSSVRLDISFNSKFFFN